jgi:hypothetical protein
MVAIVAKGFNPPPYPVEPYRILFEPEDYTVEEDKLEGVSFSPQLDKSIKKRGVRETVLKITETLHEKGVGGVAKKLKFKLNDCEDEDFEDVESYEYQKVLVKVPEPQGWNELPSHIILRAFSFLQAKDLARCTVVCQHWHIYADHSNLWKALMQDRSSAQQPMGALSIGSSQQTDDFKATYRQYCFFEIQIRTLNNLLGRAVADTNISQPTSILARFSIESLI